MLHWEAAPPPRLRIRIESIAAFNAGGMKRMYGRVDKFLGKAAFNMDIWRDRDGKLFARFWSRNREVDTESIAIHGIPADLAPERTTDEAFSDAWIPKRLRDEYEQWIIREWGKR